MWTHDYIKVLLDNLIRYSVTLFKPLTNRSAINGRVVLVFNNKGKEDKVQSFGFACLSSDVYVYWLLEMRLVRRGFLLSGGSTGKGGRVSLLKRSHVMAAVIKALHLFLKTECGGWVMAGYRHVVSSLLILLLTISFDFRYLRFTAVKILFVKSLKLRGSVCFYYDQQRWVKEFGLPGLLYSNNILTKSNKI